MYFGSYSHTLDDKGRLFIPRQLKNGLSEGSKLYIMQGFEGCLSVYNESEFQKLINECSSLSYNKKNSRAYLRVMLASVSELIVDKVGRIQLPAAILNKYQISREVVVVGIIDHFEIWDSVKFNNYQNEANDHFEELAESLDKDNE